MEDKGRYIYTVSQLTSSIKIVLEDSFQNIWIDGEISNFKAVAGHFYFTLKDDKSELKCVFFKSSNEKIKFEIKDGMQVLCGGKISIYEQR
ncbi:MAG: exodeoxyribonuclease VII large subunit, partial [Candidatus Omnitrophota bacterium]|nr:exodeoxyribonuclease VII large subunit [Candidatus Omnitrophota bacterium]